MARFARLIDPDYPHHITRHGVLTIDVVNSDDDSRVYLVSSLEQVTGRRLVWGMPGCPVKSER
jgi:hypothetical protein